MVSAAAFTPELGFLELVVHVEQFVFGEVAAGVWIVIPDAAVVGCHDFAIGLYDSRIIALDLCHELFRIHNILSE